MSGNPVNKSIMSPEFMSGALRSHKQTKFSRGAYKETQVTKNKFCKLYSDIEKKWG